MRRRSAIIAGAVCSALLAACAGQKPAVVTPATTPHAPDGTNPFAGARIYVDPEYATRVKALAARHPEQAAGLEKLAAAPTALWLDSIDEAARIGTSLDDARRQQRAGGGPVVPAFVLYDLPGRDCNAASSAGELDTDARGEARYQREFVDVIAAAFQAHPELRIAVLIEPDSLANLVTNMATPKCAAAAEFYRRGIAYAVAKLSQPNVFLYLDAAHGGWLGWPKNLTKAVRLFREVLDMAGGPERIRGFVTNVSSYDPVKDASGAPRDPNVAANDELTYVADLDRALGSVGIAGKGFVIDTRRNGRANVRSTLLNWCNVKGAGLGERPRAAPAPLVDAYLYVKTPGESDGTSDPSAPRFDPNCASDDAAPGAPQAGQLFEGYLVDLVKNATPPL